MTFLAYLPRWRRARLMSRCRTLVLLAPSAYYLPSDAERAELTNYTAGNMRIRLA